MIDIGNWPVVVTNRCADACAEAFNLTGREQARSWLLDLINNHGTLTDELPSPMTGRRSPSGYFILVDDVLVLSLAQARDGEPKWIATNCLIFPAQRAARGNAATIQDALRLSGRQLVALVNVLPHAVERFQQRCGGHSEQEQARGELLRRIAPTARAALRPPSWCGTRPADFYLIAGHHDQYCLPCRVGSGSKPFDVTTCIHRAADLFELNATQLRAHCRVATDIIRPGSRTAQLLADSFAAGGRLNWHRPRWARPHRDATWWIGFTNRITAPVAWQPESDRTPLLVLGVTDHRSLLVRLLNRLRRQR